MSRYVVVVNTQEVVEEHASEYGGEVLDDAVQVGDQVAAVVRFDDDADATQYSLRVNGTLFGAEWAARENARHRATASV